jgi:fructosamine-3-kinase
MGSRLERVRPGSRGGVFLSAEEPGGAPPPRQVIHGDLNPGNRLVSPDEPVGIVDLAPYSGSADFALAMSANWVGPPTAAASVWSSILPVCPSFDSSCCAPRFACWW